jgi:hypothetical protein
MVILLIPIFAIVCNTIVKVAKLILDPQSGRNQAKSSPELEKRVMELEHRVTTLQNLVIDSEYQLRRKLQPQQPVGAPPVYSQEHHQTQPNPINTFGG